MKMLYTVSANELWGLLGPKHGSTAPGWVHQPHAESRSIPTGSRKFLESLGLLQKPFRIGKGPMISHISNLASALKHAIQGEVTVVDWAFALQNIDALDFKNPWVVVAQRAGKDGDLLLRRLAYSSWGWRNGCHLGEGKSNEQLTIVHPSLLPADRALVAIYALQYLGYIGREPRSNEFEIKPEGWFYLGYHHETMQLEDAEAARKALANAELLNGIKL